VSIFENLAKIYIWPHIPEVKQSKCFHVHSHKYASVPDSCDARLFSKNKQVNLKNKLKIGNLTEKQAQNALAGKFNKTKN